MEIFPENYFIILLFNDFNDLFFHSCLFFYFLRNKKLLLERVVLENQQQQVKEGSLIICVSEKEKYIFENAIFLMSKK